MVLGVVLQGLVSEQERVTLLGILPIIGNVGLIMIVLEAALDLELEREKLPAILKSFLVALVALVGSSVAIAFALQYMLPSHPEFKKCLAYAIPLSIMSSAIIIPSVLRLRSDKKEFMVYESTFSDILGIMFFFFLMGSEHQESGGEIAVSILSNIFITFILAAIVAYGLVYLFQKLTSQVKLFLIIAILMLIYALAKKFHLSALVIILAFGLVLNNTDVFFRGRLNKYVNEDATKPLMHDFHTITLETAFVIRTLFFVIFGITISLSSLIDLEVALISVVIVSILFIVRLISLKIFVKKFYIPQLWIAPRGLITILLFFSISTEYPAFMIPGFDSGILLYTIIITSVIMAAALIADRGEKVSDVFIQNVKDNFKEIRDIPKTVIPGRKKTSEREERSSEREIHDNTDPR